MKALSHQDIQAVAGGCGFEVVITVISQSGDMDAMSDILLNTMLGHWTVHSLAQTLSEANTEFDDIQVALFHICEI